MCLAAVLHLVLLEIKSLESVHFRTLPFLHLDIQLKNMLEMVKRDPILWGGGVLLSKSLPFPLSVRIVDLVE
jgi:hypothetical protein